MGTVEKLNVGIVGAAGQGASFRAAFDAHPAACIHDFVRSIVEGTPCPIGIYEAMGMSLPGLISQASISAGGAWMEVPDPRAW